MSEETIARPATEHKATLRHKSVGAVPSAAIELTYDLLPLSASKRQGLILAPKDELLIFFDGSQELKRIKPHQVHAILDCDKAPDGHVPYEKPMQRRLLTIECPANRCKASGGVAVDLTVLREEYPSNENCAFRVLARDSSMQNIVFRGHTGAKVLNVELDGAMETLYGGKPPVAFDFPPEKKFPVPFFAPILAGGILLIPFLVLLPAMAREFSKKENKKSVPASTLPRITIAAIAAAYAALLVTYWVTLSLIQFALFATIFSVAAVPILRYCVAAKNRVD